MKNKKSIVAPPIIEKKKEKRIGSNIDKKNFLNSKIYIEDIKIIDINIISQFL